MYWAKTIIKYYGVRSLKVVKNQAFKSTESEDSAITFDRLWSLKYIAAEEFQGNICAGIVKNYI